MSGKKSSLFQPEEIAVYCTQMAMILKAGIPLYDGIPAIYEEMEDGRIKSALKLIEAKVLESAPLSLCMKEAGVFPPYVLSMVEVGEASGKLDEVMGSLAAYYEREKSIRARVRSAVIYPAMLFVMMAVVVAVLIVKVLPMFDQIFQQLGGELTAGASSMMRAGLVVGQCAFVLLLLVGLVALAVFLVSRSRSGGAALSRFFARFPLTRGLAAKLSARRFASAMALMLSAGLETTQALALASGVIGNPYTAGQVDQCRKLMDTGVSVSDALSRSGVFPGLFSRMISIGYRTGSTDAVMKKLADLYEDEIDVSIGNLTSLVEPVLVGVLSFLIGAILISVMLPLTGIMSSIG